LNYLLEHWTTAAVMVCCAIGSFGLFLSEILRSPDCPNYRGAPWFVRLFMFCYGLALAYRSVVLFSELRDQKPEVFDWSAPLTGFFMAGCVLAFMVDTLNRRLSAKGWRTVERVEELLCWKPRGKRSEAMATLAMRGVKVVAPGEARLPPELL
jgi:peptidoglycan/LPS O-acetylase OafA/YrhL